MIFLYTIIFISTNDCIVLMKFKNNSEKWSIDTFNCKNFKFIWLEKRYIFTSLMSVISVYFIFLYNITKYDFKSFCYWRTRAYIILAKIFLWLKKEAIKVNIFVLDLFYLSMYKIYKAIVHIIWDIQHNFQSIWTKLLINPE